MMKETSVLSNHMRIDKAGYICGATDFVQETDKEDGATLMVVDEASHTVIGYYMAYNGYWNEL